jgi:hypothetical protein
MLVIIPWGTVHDGEEDDPMMEQFKQQRPRYIIAQILLMYVDVSKIRL